jgi:spermidine synthase
MPAKIPYYDHVIADLITERQIEDPKEVEEILWEASRRANNTPLKAMVHKFHPHGITGVILLAESHIAIHSWPEYHFVGVDIFTCGKKTESKKALEYLAEVYKAKEVKVHEIKEGDVMSDYVAFRKRHWFFESSFPGVRRCKTDAFRIRKEIFRGKTPYQDVMVFESPGFGKMLAIDGIIQFSQSDEFIYHEMIAHIPLMTHPNARSMAVIGGGDGGVLREATKHRPLTNIVMIELDRQIVEVAKKYLPFVSKGAFNDPRVDLQFRNGKDFMKENKGVLDLIIVDSTDPVGPGKALFQEPFYKDVCTALKSDGIAVFQIGPFLDFELMIKRIASTLKSVFPHVAPIRLPMPSYSCGSEYCFLMASKKVNPFTIPVGRLKERARSRLGTHLADLKYYTPHMHQASLVMPKMWQLP